jgi:hypothetical protein
MYKQIKQFIYKVYNHYKVLAYKHKEKTPYKTPPTRKINKT